MRNYFKKKYIAAFFCFGLAITFTIIFLTKDKIESEKDLLEIKGPLEYYSFKHNTGYKIEDVNTILN